MAGFTLGACPTHSPQTYEKTWGSLPATSLCFKDTGKVLGLPTVYEMRNRLETEEETQRMGH